MAGLITVDSYNHTGVVVKDIKAVAESYSKKLGVDSWDFKDGDPL
jgi:hypothetical protein